MSVMDIVIDAETYPNCFTLAAEHVDYPVRWQFEISDYRNDSRALIEWVRWIAGSGGRMVSFNGIGFDYPVLHVLLQMGKADARVLYDKAMAIIHSQDENRFAHMVYPSDRHCPQLDLYKIHHFDNKARATSLKALEFNMRLDTIEDLPFPVGTLLNQDQIKLLHKYNAYDVTATKAFYHHSLDMIRFREELTKKYDRDFLNHNDTKIGKDYFIMELEKAGVQCYKFGPEGRVPMQTPRPTIALKDAILPWIKFEHPEFQRVLDWLKQQVVTETKGVFKDLSATIDGFTFVFGLGGIHGSVENRMIESSDERVIESVDVASMYPNIAIKNRFFPAHLGEKFCEIYQRLYEERKRYPKGSAENAMLKLALNGTYGDSNNKFSVFYDPLMTLRITLTGQLTLCMLAEMLMTIPTVEIIMCNTDGLEYAIHPHYVQDAVTVCSNWEAMTQLTLERARYKRMFILNVNNYLAEYDE